MQAGPVVTRGDGGEPERVAVDGASFSIHEWRGSGPPHLHVHHEDDEAWHVLAGTLTFRFAGRTEEVGAGSTVFVPAGVAHTYSASPSARYLVVLTPRLRSLIVELQANRDRSADAEIYRRHRSELVETG
ncbi:MAG TPA: cupin domain-containing protein [Terriglobales bacterium]|nr:cupin domain-containing protein [Terriglobales bacterium]